MAMRTLIRDGVEKVTIKQARQTVLNYNSSASALAEDVSWEGCLQSAIQVA